MQFLSIDPVEFEVAYIWTATPGAYVATLSGGDGASCLDVLPDKESTKVELDAFDDYPDTQKIPPDTHFNVIVDAIAEVSSARATYAARASDEVQISSAAWYRRKGEQVFLACPQGLYDWKVYRVVSARRVR
ncbi:hypothetical protein [Erythrobacter crassostreae]|uniref:Uncharacterized protein n=1 Tax=Erythrobacter crassostreae TaxID=2828328 RepID=A0A9X1JN00_9SPHN|nr:hypothetical protein [Erythrobacter crassostrea]MBV7257977.1 hypothetical protein [Erythrobacter crassostrea]